MSEEESAAISNRWRLVWWLWLPVFLGALVIAWELGRKEPVDPWPVLCLHADGKVTLGSFEGRSVSMEELTAMGRRMQLDATTPCLTLKPAAGLPIEAWFDTINATAEGGIGNYEFQSGHRKLAFHVPGCCLPRDDSPPEIIDLREGSAEAEEDGSIFGADLSSANGYDKHVLGKPAMSFEDLYDAISPHLRPGVSMLIDGPRYRLMRDRDEDRRTLPPKKPSQWERLKEKAEGWVK